VLILLSVDAQRIVCHSALMRLSHVLQIQCCMSLSNVLLRLTALRKVELKAIRSFAFANAYSMVVLMSTPMIMVLIVLVTYFNSDGIFSPSTVFTAVSLLLSIRFALFMLPASLGKHLHTILIHIQRTNADVAAVYDKP
jgi:hypothetical protein